MNESTKAALSRHFPKEQIKQREERRTGRDGKETVLKFDYVETAHYIERLNEALAALARPVPGRRTARLDHHSRPSSSRTGRSGDP